RRSRGLRSWPSPSIATAPRAPLSFRSCAGIRGSPMRRELTCRICGREFSTEVFVVQGRPFPGSRICDVCRGAEQVNELQQRADIRFVQAGVPAPLEDATFSSFERLPGVTEAVRLAEDWARRFRIGPRPRRGLFLWGPPGSGKTHLAAAIVREAVYN